MGRRKIIMDYIKDDRKRMSTFEKRRIGLFKKARELSKLCGVNITVNIINSKSLYQFTDSHKDDIAHKLANRDLKVEENFNNESFQEYLTKKSLNQKISTESSSNEYRSICQEQVLLNSEDDEDEPFFKVLQERKVLDSFIKIQHNEDGKNDSRSGNIVTYRPPSPATVFNSYNTAESNNNCQLFSYTQSLQLFDDCSTSRSNIINPYSDKNTDGLCESIYSRDSVSFDNIITTMQNDPEIFENFAWNSHKEGHNQLASNLQFFSVQGNDSRKELDTPILESWNHLLTTTSDFEDYSATGYDIPLTKKQKLTDDACVSFRECAR